jgi:GNAT superfamily N-acetyltransferase
MNRNQIIQSERAEQAALADLHAAASPAARRALGLDLVAVDGALLSIASEDDNILANRALGLGVEHATDRQTVAEIAERYAAAGVDRYFLHLDPHARPNELSQWLGEAGLAPYHRPWAKFVRDTASPPRLRSDLEVRRIGAEDADSFGRIASEAFGMADAWARVLAGLVELPDWQVFLSFDGDQPAGCGATRIHDRVAWMDWHATRPEFRRRGSQGALLGRAITDAVDAGCRMMACSTGEAVEGDPQHSYGNILRYGFSLSHSRANWVPESAGSEAR